MSTSSLAVMDQLKYVHENLDSGASVISLFLDFSKEFDCIDHTILLGKLYRYCVRGIPLHQFNKNVKPILAILKSCHMIIVAQNWDARH